MKKLSVLFLLLPLQLLAQPFSSSEINRWKQEAKAVTIIRDNWGIPHIMVKQMQMPFLVYSMHNVKMILSV